MEAWREAMMLADRRDPRVLERSYVHCINVLEKDAETLATAIRVLKEQLDNLRKAHGLADASPENTNRT